MHSHKHARLMVALVAAVSLHALGLLILISPQPHLSRSLSQTLWVELIAPLPSPPGIPNTSAHSMITQETPSLHTSAIPSNVSQHRAMPDVLPVHVTPIHSTPPIITNPSNNAKPEHAPPEHKQMTITQPQRLPQSIQQQIMAEVHYPLQARRRGWQGKAEFQLDVQQQGIQHVIMLASSGYPILDRAAQRGIAAVTRLPLSNGMYRLPIVFRLQ